MTLTTHKISPATIEIRNEQGEEVARVPAHNGMAPLFAAAPEMLEALHHILNIEGATFAADENEWHVAWHFAKVREAIAKAEQDAMYAQIESHLSKAEGR